MLGSLRNWYFTALTRMAMQLGKLRNYMHLFLITRYIRVTEWSRIRSAASLLMLYAITLDHSRITKCSSLNIPGSIWQRAIWSASKILKLLLNNTAVTSTKFQELGYNFFLYLCVLCYLLEDQRWGRWGCSFQGAETLERERWMHELI